MAVLIVPHKGTFGRLELHPFATVIIPPVDSARFLRGFYSCTTGFLKALLELGVFIEDSFIGEADGKVGMPAGKQVERLFTSSAVDGRVDLQA